MGEWGGGSLGEVRDGACVRVFLLFTGTMDFGLCTKGGTSAPLLANLRFV